MNVGQKENLFVKSLISKSVAHNVLTRLKSKTLTDITKNHELIDYNVFTSSVSNSVLDLAANKSPFDIHCALFLCNPIEVKNNVHSFSCKAIFIEKGRPFTTYFSDYRLDQFNNKEIQLRVVADPKKNYLLIFACGRNKKLVQSATILIKDNTQKIVLNAAGVGLAAQNVFKALQDSIISIVPQKTKELNHKLSLTRLRSLLLY